MPKRNLILILAIAAAAAVTVWVTRNNPPMITISEQGRLQSVVDAYDKIHDNYYPVSEPSDLRKPRMSTTAPTEASLCQGAVRGMIKSLKDEYSMYFPPAEVENFRQRIMGRSRTLGMKFEQAGRDIRVLGCLVQSPAYKAGIIRDDILTAVDGEPVAGKDIAAVRAMLDGKIGSEVTLDLIRPGGKKESLTIKREEFAIESVEGLYRNSAGRWIYRLGDDCAYVRITEFVPDTLEHVQSALRGLVPLRGVVLDLRDNPGGEFNVSLAVADLFLREGTIVTVFSRNAEPRKHKAVDNGTLGDDIPVVVLINGKSASGAEIVAGALAVNDRAVLVGTPTRGKGCMQKIIELDGGLGLINLTTSEFFVGDDQPVSKRGIAPNWNLPLGNGIEPAATEAVQDELARIRMEIELSGPRPATAPAATEPTTSPTLARERLLELDNQLAAAAKLVQDPQAVNDFIKVARRIRQSAATKPATTSTSKTATSRQ